jgi:hypothetical protein
MPKSQYAQPILKAARKYPEELTTVRSFARFVIKDAKLDISESAMRYHVNNVATENNLLFEADIATSVEDDLSRYRDKTSEKKFQRQYNQLMDRHVALQEAYDDLMFVRDYEVRLMEIPHSAADLRGQAVPILQWSDWHVEKRIDAAVMNGLNEYNPEIAKYRAKVLFHNTAKMLELHSQHSTMTQGVLHLGGDFIEGYLREHNLRENYMTPIEAVPFAAELIISGIQYLLDIDLFEVLWVLCSRGNHPRTTKKMDSDDYKMNLETLIYHMVVEHFKDDSRVVFHHEKSDIGYFDIMGKTIRYVHAHQIQYNGGVGGLAIPMRKAVLNWNTTQHADETLGCHFHTSYKPLRDYMQNGALCGYDWYAMSVVKAEYQAPLQSMEMLIGDRGFRMFTSIDCE